tara:strand:- start:300 stop:578 length:279 start_codon:yes stop_codon:yes gene_type:complete
MSYTITEHTRRQARKLGVTVKRSLRKGKKIAVFRNGKKLVDVGAIGYGDFPTFTRTKGKEYADKRRKLYKIRHNKDRHKVGTPSYWADKLLW